MESKFVTYFNRSKISIFTGKNYTFINGILLDENLEVVLKDRFLGYQPHKIDKNLPVEFIDNEVFVMNYIWSYNYHINYFESLPQIFLYKELYSKNKNLYCTVQKAHRKLYEYLFLLLDLDIKKILNNNNIKCKKCIYSNFGRLYFLHNKCLKINNLHFKLNNLLKNSFIKKHNYKNSNKNILYIYRLNNSIGKNRYIKNDENLKAYIKKIGGDIISCENLSLQEKFENISNYKIIITPIGANLVNLYFSDLSETKKIILLGPDVKIKDYITWNIKLLNEFVPEKQISTLLGKPEIIFSKEDGDLVNQPYEINLNELEKLINT